MRTRKTAALVIFGLIAMSAATYAQMFGGQGGRRGGGRRGGFGGYQSAPRRPNAQSFTGDFTFCRIAYQQASDGIGGSWGVDYPRADQNLSIRLSELSKTPVNFDASHEPNYYVVTMTDPELFSCPFVMITEVGSTYIGPEEARSLKSYLLKGGFLWADDFWGEYAWEHWESELRKVLPAAEYPIVDLPLTHSMFHTLFDVNRIPQIPSINFWGGPGGSTSERGADSAVPHGRAILDNKGRVMVFITHNTDFGDAYEREGDDPAYFYTFSVDGYAIGIDTILYAMTH
jgi:Domain of unknown function (DUF4159)